MNIIAWIFTPFVIIYFMIRYCVFGVIELFIPNKTQEKDSKQPARAGRVESAYKFANATKEGEPMSDQRFNDITMYMERGCKRGIPPKVLAMSMMQDLQVTPYEAELMQQRINEMVNNDVL